jgi:hypothetical protein
MDHTIVNYTITNFNKTEKQLDVVFDDGGWAKIQLKAPLPTNQEELEAVIKQFTPPVEVIQAKNASPDLGFISSLVNQSKQMTRASTADVVLPDGTKVLPNAGTAPTQQQIKNMQLRQQYSLAEQLVSFGVLKTNPVDLTQIVKETTIATQPISTGTQTL